MPLGPRLPWSRPSAAQPPPNAVPPGALLPPSPRFKVDCSIDEAYHYDVAITGEGHGAMETRLSICRPAGPVGPCRWINLFPFLSLITYTGATPRDAPEKPVGGRGREARCLRAGRHGGARAWTVGVQRT